MSREQRRRIERIEERRQLGGPVYEVSNRPEGEEDSALPDEELSIEEWQAIYSEAPNVPKHS